MKSASKKATTKTAAKAKPAAKAPAGSAPPAADQSAIFDQLKKLLETYAPPFSPRTGTVKNKRDYQLYSEKPVEIEGRKYPGIFFAGLIEQKGYIGFYYMPVYTTKEATALLPAPVMKLLKGKSCFYVKSLDATLLADFKRALDVGFGLYKKRGWV